MLTNFENKRNKRNELIKEFFHDTNSNDCGQENTINPLDIANDFILLKPEKRVKKNPIKQEYIEDLGQEEIEKKLCSTIASSESYDTYYKEHEKILSKNKLERKTPITGGACGSSCLIKLQDDGFGVFKPYTDYQFEQRREQIQNERAAYLIDLFLGFDLVPPTTARTLDKDTEDLSTEQVGSIQQYMEDAHTGYSLNNEELSNIPMSEVMKMTVFDWMIQNNDRHRGNFLVKDKKIYGIDHGLCLGSEIHAHGSSDIETVLSNKGPHIRSKLLNEEAFWLNSLPEENVEKLRTFLNSNAEQELFSRLLTKLIGEHRAAIYHRRIRCIIRSISEDGSINSAIFEKEISSARNEFRANSRKLSPVIAEAA